MPTQVIISRVSSSEIEKERGRGAKLAQGEEEKMASSSFFLLLLLGSALFISNGVTASLPELPNLTTLSFEEGYTQLFGDNNFILHCEGRTVHLSLDQRTGSPPLFPCLVASISVCFARSLSPICRHRTGTRRIILCGKFILSGATCNISVTCDTVSFLHRPK